MSRTLLPFSVPDISALARSLKDQLDARDHMPGHVELLNMLARAVGCRNFQQFRVQGEGAVAPVPASLPDQPKTEPVDSAKITRLARLFDAEGRLTRWPGKQSQQTACLWALWSRLPAKQVLSEPEVNARLTEAHLFGDYALLRRLMCDYGMMERTVDGREYRRVERRPPPDALALIQAVGRQAN